MIRNVWAGLVVGVSCPCQRSLGSIGVWFSVGMGQAIPDATFGLVFNVVVATIGGGVG